MCTISKVCKGYKEKRHVFTCRFSLSCLCFILTSFFVNSTILLQFVVMFCISDVSSASLICGISSQLTVSNLIPQQDRRKNGFIQITLHKER